MGAAIGRQSFGALSPAILLLPALFEICTEFIQIACLKNGRCGVTEAWLHCLAHSRVLGASESQLAAPFSLIQPFCGSLDRAEWRIIQQAALVEACEPQGCIVVTIAA